MNNGHSSTERLFEASEGVDLAAEEMEHIRDCSDCREVLNVLRRHNRLRLQKLGNASITHHLPLAELWQHAHGAEVDGMYQSHLVGCELCTGTLGLCRATSSLRDVLRLLKESGFQVE